MITEEVFDIICIKGKTYPKFRRLTFTGEKKPKFTSKDGRTAYIADKIIFDEDDNSLRLHKEE